MIPNLFWEIDGSNEIAPQQNAYPPAKAMYSVFLQVVSKSL